MVKTYSVCNWLFEIFHTCSITLVISKKDESTMLLVNLIQRGGGGRGEALKCGTQCGLQDPGAEPQWGLRGIAHGSS